MERLGWVSWQPPILGAHNLYYLTEAGRKLCEDKFWREPVTLPRSPGADVIIVCPSCGWQWVPEDEKCPNCGHGIDQSLQ